VSSLRDHPGWAVVMIADWIIDVEPKGASKAMPWSRPAPSEVVAQTMGSITNRYLATALENDVNHGQSS
jgi:excinuclease UvrABC ATPase subunit